jgi:SH3 domain protein
MSHGKRGEEFVPRRSVAVAFSLALLLVSPAAGEESWVRGAPLELRSGGSTRYRVLGFVAPGEQVELLQKGDGWARVRTGAGREGWLELEHLDDTAPPVERVEQLEAEATRLGSDVAALESERDRLREAAGEIEGRAAERRAELDRLLRENARLAAGERWRDWLTGAGILASGLVLGALWRGLAGGRRARLRL